MNFSDEEEPVEGKSKCNKNILLVTRRGDVDGLVPKVSEGKDQVEGGIVRQTRGKVNVFDEKNKKMMSEEELESAISGQLARVALKYWANDARKPAVVSKFPE